MVARFLFAAGVFLLIVPARAAAQDDALVRAYPADACPSCAGWNEPQRPVHLFGNTYYVGTRGLGAILIASPEGHVLIDGGLPDSAPLILASIRALGFDPADVKLILNSHEHFDHAGGIAALQRATGARVAASPAAAAVLERGTPNPGDPQFGLLFDMPRLADVQVLRDSQAVRVGPITLTPYFTGSHAPGGTTWAWQSCESGRCLMFVYADSQTPVSHDDFRFSRHEPLLAEYARSFRVLENLTCDVLITPHPGASSLWQRASSAPDGLVDPDACRRYADHARNLLRQRLERESR